MLLSSNMATTHTVMSCDETQLLCCCCLTNGKSLFGWRFDEFDEAIEEAIEEDLKEAEGGGKTV